MKPKVNHKEKKDKKATEENKKSNLDTKCVLLPALALPNDPKTRVPMNVVLLLLTSVLANLGISIWNCYVQFLVNLNICLSLLIGSVTDLTCILIRTRRTYQESFKCY